MSQHTVKMSVELDVLKSSVDNLQKVLDTLKPNTKAFTSLQSVIRSITKDLDTAENQMRKGFSSNAQFTATEKVIEKISAALLKAGQSAKKIKFSDLKLDNTVSKQYDELVQKIKKTEQEFNKFQKTAVSQTLKQGNNKQILQFIDPNLVNKNFDQVVAGIKNGVKQAQQQLQSLTQVYNTLQQQMQKTAQVQSRIDVGDATSLKSLLGDDSFKKFFSQKQNGSISFKGIKNTGEGGMRNLQLRNLQLRNLQLRSLLSRNL